MSNIEDRVRSGGELVAVAIARDRFEAEMIEGLLAGAGIRSLVEGTGLTGPGFGMGGLNPRRNEARVMVHAERFEEARTLLAETLVAEGEAEWPRIAASLDEARGKPRKGLFARLFGERER